MRFLVTLIGAGVLASAAAAAGPTFDRTASGDAAAIASLLTPADLSKADGWTLLAAGTNSGFTFSCPGWSPSARGIVEIGAATSPDFYSGGTQPVGVLQMTDVYDTAAQAATMWQRAVKPGLTRCMAETLDEVTQKGLDVRLISEQALTVEKVGPMTAGYRVIAELYNPSTKTQRKTYFDLIVLGRGRTLSEIALTSIGATTPAKVEYALALIVYHRIS